MRTHTVLRYAVVIAIAGTFAATAFAQCPTKFKLSGKTTKYWRETTNSAWGKMLPKGWVDKGFHFYSRVKQRGPDEGINSPSDLESEIMKKVTDRATLTRNRREIVLPIKNSRGESLKVIYDYDGRRSSNCELVTLTF